MSNSLKNILKTIENENSVAKSIFNYLFFATRRIRIDFRSYSPRSAMDVKLYIITVWRVNVTRHERDEHKRRDVRVFSQEVQVHRKMIFHVSTLRMAEQSVQVVGHRFADRCCACGVEMTTCETTRLA